MAKGKRGSMEEIQQRKMLCESTISEIAKELEAELGKEEPDKNTIQAYSIALQEESTSFVNIVKKLEDVMIQEKKEEQSIVKLKMECHHFKGKMAKLEAKIKSAIGDPPESVVQGEAQQHLSETGMTSSNASVVSESATAGTSASSMQMPGTKLNFKLPRVEIPKFSGELKDWKKWWGLFKSIHTMDIDVSQKFVYLAQAMEKNSEPYRIPFIHSALIQKTIRK